MKSAPTYIGVEVLLKLNWPFVIIYCRSRGNQLTQLGAKDQSVRAVSIGEGVGPLPGSIELEPVGSAVAQRHEASIGDSRNTRNVVCRIPGEAGDAELRAGIRDVVDVVSNSTSWLISFCRPKRKSFTMFGVMVCV